MRRSVIKQASQSYTVTLPIAWVRKTGVDKSREVDVNEVEKALVISTTNVVAGEKIALDAKGMGSRSLYLHVNALYARGVDEIEITSDKDISSKLIGHLDQTIGYAVVKQRGNTCVIRDMSGSSSQDLDEIFKRVFQMVLSFYDAAIEDIAWKSNETFEGLKVRDHEVNKFALYLQRAINKLGYPDSVQGRTLFAYSFMLEKLGDEVERLWRCHLEKGIKTTPALVALMRQSRAVLEEAFHIYYQHKTSRIDDLYKLRNAVREAAAQLGKLDPITADAVRHIIKIADDCGDLTQLSLMKTLKHA